MGFRILPPFFSTGALFGNAVRLDGEEAAAGFTRLGSAQMSSARDEPDAEAEDQLPQREEAYYWAFIQTHL